MLVGGPQQFTATLEGLARQNVELQNELAHSRQQAAQHSDRKSEVFHCVGRRRRESVWTRLLVKPSDFSLAQDAWRDWSTVFKGYAGAAILRLQKLMDDAGEGDSADPPKRHDLGRRRSGSVGTAPLDDAHDLQGCSSQYRGRRQRRSRSLATTDREVRAEDENLVCRATDVHPVLLIPR